RAGWKTDKFIHMDLRWSNCFLPRPELKKGAGVDPCLNIVDWELAGWGDPLWDVGTILSNFLSFWVSGIPVTGGCHPDRYLDAAEVPLERLRPAMRAFWLSYLHGREVDNITSSQWLVKSVEYAAAQLVQNALENQFNAAQLSGGVLCLLQLSLNLFDR